MNFWQKNNCQFDKNAILQTNIYDNWFRKYDCQICWLLVVVWPHPCLSLIWIETIKSIYFSYAGKCPFINIRFDYKKSTYYTHPLKVYNFFCEIRGLKIYKFLYFKTIQFKNETILLTFALVTPEHFHKVITHWLDVQLRWFYWDWQKILRECGCSKKDLYLWVIFTFWHPHF